VGVRSRGPPASSLVFAIPIVVKIVIVASLIIAIAVILSIRVFITFFTEKLRIHPIVHVSA
jgi:hypothetical protein